MPDTLDERPGSEQGVKRRRSDEDDVEGADGKRLRMSPPRKDSSVTHSPELKSSDKRVIKAEPIDEKPVRARRPVADEKQRSKRLFGALLGPLNQPGGDRTSKRRQEIEARRKAELEKQDEERKEEKARLAEKRAERRKEVQRQVDEENMRMRHDDLLNTANFLQTVAEPRLFYRPWDLRPDEEDRIEEQVKEAHTRIKRELTGSHASDDKSDQVETTNSDTLSASRDVKSDETHSEPNTEVEAPQDPKTQSDSREEAQAPQEETPAKSVVDTDRSTNEDQTQEDVKPAKLPDSPTTNRDTHDNEVADSKLAGLSSDSEATAKKLEDEPGKQQQQMEDVQEDEGDHGAEADEDTVIY